MAQLQLYTGSTQIQLNVYIKNSVSGNGLTGLTAASAGLSAYYFIAGNTMPVLIPLSAVTLGTWVAGGFVEVDPVHCPGLYALGLPNVAWNGRMLTIILQGAAQMVPVAYEIELTATNNQDALRGGLLALPAGPMMFKKGQSLANFEFLMVNSVDGRTPMPGLTVTSAVSKDGALPVFTDNAPTEIVSPLFSGMYKINLTINDTSGNTLTYFFMAPGAQTTVVEIITQP
jgi:hypothetical protein